MYQDHYTLLSAHPARFIIETPLRMLELEVLVWEFIAID